MGKQTVARLHWLPYYEKKILWKSNGLVSDILQNSFCVQLKKKKWYRLWTTIPLNYSKKTMLQKILF